MAITTSWGYTNGTTQKTAGFKMPVLSSTDYAECMRDNSSNDRTVAQYRNLTTPANQGEYIQFRAERRDKISKSFKTAYPPASPKGYMFSVKMEDVMRRTDEQGISTDEPVSITLTCQATDGTNVTGGIATGADWLNLYQRFNAFLMAGVYDQSDDAITVNQSSQPVFDKLMHTVASLDDAITTQA